MIRDRLEALIAAWPDDRGDPPDTDYQRGYLAACEEHARELAKILAEEEGREPDCAQFARQASTSGEAALWVIADRLGALVDAFPPPPGARP